MPEKASANARSKVAILASETPVRVGRLPQMADVRVLGPVEVVDDAGQVLEIGGTRPRAVLALLAVRSPESVTVDEIIEQLWGDSDIADPEASLRVTVSRIRSATTEGLIATTSSGYRLEVPRSRLDLDRFRRYSARGRQYATLGHPAKAAESFRQALGQWRGAPLSDVTQFLFADKAASQLEEERLSAIEALVECEIGTGSHDLVIGDLSGLVERFPYRENLWRLLMVSLYRSGRQAEAIRAFARYRDLLGEELGLEPSAALSDLEERILLHDPALDDLPELASSEWLEEPELETFAVGDFVVREGEPADTVYWIESGRVEVGRESPEGDWHTLAELGPGRYFGELASLLGTTRTASVRVVVPTTVSIHNAASFRMRMGIQQSEEDEAPAAADLADLIRRGQYLQAYDGAARLIDRGNADPEVRHLATLALVRSGATSQARRRFDQYGLASIDPKSVSPRLAEDIAALAARLDKDMALASTGADREAWARRSAAAYQAASDPEAGAYPAVNAAFMWLVAGAVDRAETAARLALEAVEHADSKSGEDAYWDLAIEAEAALILGDLERARSALEGAASISIGNHSARAITTKQLRRICAIKDIGADILQPIRNPAVAHYCGHLILPPGREGRFVAADEARVSAELASAFDQLDVAVGYGSLAAGADILAAEALLDRGAELNVVLPFDRDEFIRTSVIPAGADWVDRFERCLASAESVVIAMTGGYLDDPVLFDFCSRIAMGDALIRASYLAADAHQVAVWDGVKTQGAAGTSVDVNHWKGTGRPTLVVGVGPGDQTPTRSSELSRQIRAVVFGDFAGFSVLSDRQAIIFQESVIGKLAEVLEPARGQILMGRTWGDGIYLVFEDVRTAAECALVLQEAVHAMDFTAMGLAPIRGLRMAAHATPVFEGWDPISQSALFYGAGVTKTARIEPRTPEGEIYTSHPFAALAVLDGSDAFDCQYVGNTPTAKGYGSLPLFALRRRS